LNFIVRSPLLRQSIFSAFEFVLRGYTVDRFPDAGEQSTCAVLPDAD
jgi:hypothetical protein